MARVYLADDEPQVRLVLEAFLTREGHEAVGFGTCEELLAAFRERPCDLVLLDVMMPGIDGVEALRRLRATSQVPVVLLTARDGDGDFCRGLRLGADDYVTKPFKPELLMAKVSALLRRASLQAAPALGNLALDPVRREASVDGRALALTPTEYGLLSYLFARPGAAVSKAELMAEVWGVREPCDTRAAEEASRRLRHKLMDAGSDWVNETVWGFGWRLADRS